MALLDDLMAHLASEGAGTVGTDIFAGVLLDTQPDEVTVLFEITSLPHQQTFGAGDEAVARAGVQVQTRGAAWDYAAARARAITAKTALQSIVNEMVNGTLYHRVSHTAGPTVLRRDEQERVVFMTEFDVWRVPE